MEVIRVIFTIFFWIATVYTLYNALMFLVGMIVHKQKYPIIKDQEKFCVFVPCHNEGPVVESTVENYTHITYDKNLFEVYFIADNCSDNTASVLKGAIKKYKATNFHVLERNNSPADKRGKPHALRWAIEELESKDEFYSKYDLLMIFDADNFVDPDILTHINSQYLNYKPNKRPAMIQTYLDSKNNKGIIAKGYYASYRVMCSFWYNGKQALHLVPQVGGTGFATEMSFLKEIGGFNCKSLTEDLEICTIATVKNRTVAYNGRVHVYDEKPTRLKQSLVQRTRWAQGHWYVCFHYLPILFIQLFNPKTIRNFFRKLDAIIYLVVRFYCLCASLTLLFGLFWGLHNFTLAAINATSFDSFINFVVHPEYISGNPVLDFTNGNSFWINPVLTVCGVVSFFAVPLASLYDGTEYEKKRTLKDLIPNFVSLSFISIIDLIVTWPGLFKSGNQKVWKKTAHNVTSVVRAGKK